jgi:beta-galactosidase
MRQGANEYSFQVPDGRYEIELRFRRTEVQEPHFRGFSVNINGQSFIKRLDLVAEAGYMTALTRKTAVTATGSNGSLLSSLTAETFRQSAE